MAVFSEVDVKNPLPSADAPIGIFGSGVGGLTIAKSIIDGLPQESLIYIGDTINGPYGSLPITQVRKYALEVADKLVERGCKMIIIACNTASAACLRDARERYNIPIIEVTLPSARKAVTTTRNGIVGVIGTMGTINSHAYQDLFTATPVREVHAIACPLFVDFVERGITSGDSILEIAKDYLAPLRNAGIDTLVLGCTHYSLLSHTIQLAAGYDVTLVSSAEEIAKDVLYTLRDKNLLHPTYIPADPTYRFESTGEVESFEKLIFKFLGPFHLKEKIDPNFSHIITKINLGNREPSFLSNV